MSRRIITTENLEEDVKIESHLRPQLLDDYIGQEKAKEILEKAEDKSQAILEAVELINETANKDLIEQILKESTNANAKVQNFNKLGLRQLTDEENKFYDALKTDV